VDSAEPSEVDRVVADVKVANPDARIVLAESPVELEDGPPLEGKTVLVVDDGPTLTHGGMPFGAGTVAARRAGAAELVDPRRYAVGSIKETFERWPRLGTILPAMGYSADQLVELEATINATDCDVVVIGTPIDLARLIDIKHPVRRATYSLRELGETSLEDLLQPIVRLASRKVSA
ncbi:MAG: GTPase, partial [Gaiellaceae bacterium]